MRSWSGRRDGAAALRYLAELGCRQPVLLEREEA
jgi:hypothetical protein